MPNISEDKLPAELTKIRPHIPILLWTGGYENFSKEKAVSIGIKAVLLKPIIMEDFFQKISELLG